MFLESKRYFMWEFSSCCKNISAIVPEIGGSHGQPLRPIHT